MAMGAVERDAEYDSGVMLWTGTGRTSQACRAAWEKQNEGHLEMHPVGCLGVELWAK